MPADPQYKMEATPRGVCLIISNKTFKKDASKPETKKLEARKGADAERDSLKATFEEMLFEVRCHDNLTDKKMLKLLRDVADEDHSKRDAFVCCILTYGDQHMLYGSNGLSVKLRSLLLTLKTQHCRTLEGKPKLFFVQSCPVPVAAAASTTAQQDDDDADHVSRPEGGEGGNPTPANSGSDGQQDSKDKDSTKILPNETDFLLDMCSKLSLVTAPSPESASLYVQQLTKLVGKYGGSREFVEIITAVHETLAKRESGGAGAGAKKNKVNPAASAAAADNDNGPPRHSLRMKLKIGPCPKVTDVRLLIVGKSRRGKSSVANTVLGESKFSVNNTFGDNLASGWHKVTRDGRTIEVTEMPTELDSDEAARPMITVTPGPHAIILCFRCEQFFSAADYFEYSTLKKWLGSHCSKYTILAFSGLDSFNTGRQRPANSDPSSNFAAAEEMMKNSFISIIRELPSPDRVICLDNTMDLQDRRLQGDRLLRLVDRVVSDNNGGHFSNKKIRSMEEEVQYQLGRRGQKREEIKKRVVAGDDIELIFEKQMCCTVM